MNWTEPLDDTERFIHAAFAANFERLKEVSGHSLTPWVKESALQQVILYYRRLQGLAEQVDETEVRLVLPDQFSPSGRPFILEGVVDIVRDNEITVMYDVKTYLDADAARDHVEPHFRQLNVYAHIWASLRGKALHKVAVIATRPTRSLSHALRTGDPRRIDAAVRGWDPVLEVPVDPEIVNDVMRDFGSIVDRIEDREFSPPTLPTLRGPSRPNGRTPFAQDVCLNCDVRFGCSVYRQFVRAQGARGPDAALQASAADFGGEVERSDWIDAGLPTLDRQNEIGERS